VQSNVGQVPVRGGKDMPILNLILRGNEEILVCFMTSEIERRAISSINVHSQTSKTILQTRSRRVVEEYKEILSYRFPFRFID